MKRQYHELKLRAEFWDAVHSDIKRFEVRENDRGFQHGDQVRFLLVTKASDHVEAVGPWFEINYVLTGWGLKEGFAAFGITRVPEQEDG